MIHGKPTSPLEVSLTEGVNAMETRIAELEGLLREMYERFYCLSEVIRNDTEEAVLHEMLRSKVSKALEGKQ